MATKKKTKKKSTKSKKAAGRKVKPTKKLAKSARTSKKSAKAAARNKGAAKTKLLKKATSAKTAIAGSNKPRKRGQRRAGFAFSDETLGPGSGGQSGDLQGLSDA